MIILYIAFYIIGCFPSAYILVKYKTGKNIFNEGTGNNGAANSLDVSSSKLIAILVLLFDFFKGFIPALFLKYLNYSNYEIFTALSFLLLGHNYNVFFKFKGGKGLASAAGIFLFFAPIYIPIWLISYFTIQRIINNVDLSSIISIIIIVVVGAFSNLETFNFVNLTINSNEKYFLLMSVSTILISKHFKLFYNYIGKNNER